jgi:hypothetical protein
MLEAIMVQHLIWFQLNANDETFTHIWGQRLGNHLWQKFKQDGEFNLLKLCAKLDTQNIEKLTEWINTHIN